MRRLVGFLLCALGYLGIAEATEFPLREDGADIFGQVERIRTRYEDTLIQIARRYSLGYEELLRVNQGVDPWLPGEGTEVLIPGQRLLPPGVRRAAGQQRCGGGRGRAPGPHAGGWWRRRRPAV